MKEKKELVRIVKAPDLKDENGEVIQAGEISVDFIGKKPGRGAYICRSNACLASAKKQDGLKELSHARFRKKYITSSRRNFLVNEKFYRFLVWRGEQVDFHLVSTLRLML